jgi:Chlorophyll A-B binding protein
MQTQPKPDLRDDVQQSYLSQGSKWKWGFSPSAEIWNGRLAMIGFLAATIVEITTGHGYLRLLGLLSGNDVLP